MKTPKNVQRVTVTVNKRTKRNYTKSALYVWVEKSSARASWHQTERGDIVYIYIENTLVHCLLCVWGAIDVIWRNTETRKAPNRPEPCWETDRDGEDEKERRSNTTFYHLNTAFFLKSAKQRFDHSIRVLFAVKFQRYESIFIKWIWLMNSATFVVVIVLLFFCQCIFCCVAANEREREMGKKPLSFYHALANRLFRLPLTNAPLLFYFWLNVKIESCL